MQSGDTLSTRQRKNRRQARQVVHVRARLDYGTSPRRKRERVTLSPALAPAYPLLSRHLDTHDGWPPPVTRSAAARIRHLDALYAAFGPLVLLRLSLPALDALQLHSREMSSAARDLVDDRLVFLVLSGAVYTVNLQRGADGGIHAHIVVPLAFLEESCGQVIAAAPHGPGGGCDIHHAVAHGVMIRSTKTDRVKVARYVSRHPDGRLDDPTSTAYLDALEAELHRKAQRLPRVQLGWKRRIPRLPTKRLISPTYSL